MVADHRGALGAALRPVAAGRSSPPANAVPSGCEPVRMSCRFGVSPRPLTTLALLGQRGLLGEVVAAPCSSATFFGDHHALGVAPRPVADAVARVDGGLAVGLLGAEVGAPGVAAGAGRLAPALAIGVGALEPAEIGAVAGPALVTKNVMSTSCACAAAPRPSDSTADVSIDHRILGSSLICLGPASQPADMGSNAGDFDTAVRLPQPGSAAPDRRSPSRPSRRRRPPGAPRLCRSRSRFRLPANTECLQSPTGDDVQQENVDGEGSEEKQSRGQEAEG